MTVIASTTLREQDDPEQTKALAQTVISITGADDWLTVGVAWNNPRNPWCRGALGGQTR